MTIKIIDMNSGEVIPLPTMGDALDAITIGRIAGGKWCINNDTPNDLVTESLLKTKHPKAYIAYNDIPSVFTKDDMAHYADIGF